MANLTETDSFDAGVYEFQTTDAALGGPGGVMNTPGGNLANRTRYLFNRVTEILSGSSRYVSAGGTVNAIAANYSQVVTALTDGLRCRAKAIGANTSATTFTPCDGTVAGTTAIPPLPIYGVDGNALTGGEIVGQFEVQYSASLNGGAGGWYLVSNPGGYQRATAAPANDDTSKTASTGWVWTNIQALVASCIAGVATAAGFGYSFSTIGYLKFPSWLGSLTFQWGNVTVAAQGSPTFYFPTAFGTKCFAIVGSIGNGLPSLTSNNLGYGVQAYGTTQYTVALPCTFSGSNFGTWWIAVGY